MTRGRGPGEKAGLTKMAGEVAGLLWWANRALERIDWHVDALVDEGVLTRRDVQTLKRLSRRLSDRGRLVRFRRAEGQP